MSSKYHINGKGVPAICKATKGNCPFGGSESHYHSKEEAQSSADSKNEEEFGLINSVKSYASESDTNENKVDSKMFSSGGDGPRNPFTHEGRSKVVSNMVISNLVNFDSRGNYLTDTDAIIEQSILGDKDALDKFGKLVDPKSKDIDEDDVEFEARQEILYHVQETDKNSKKIQDTVDNIVLMRNIMKETDDEIEVRSKMEDYHIDKLHKNSSKSIEGIYKRPSEEKMEEGKRLLRHLMMGNEVEGKEKALNKFKKSRMFELQSIRYPRNLASKDTMDVAYKMAKEFHNNKILSKTLFSRMEDFDRVQGKMNVQFEKFFK